MSERSILITLGVLVLLSTGALLYVLWAYGALSSYSFIPTPPPGATITNEPPAFDPLSTFGRLTVQGQSGITVEDLDGNSHVYGISPLFKVFSQVAAGETGKTLAELPEGTPLFLVHDQTKNNTLTAVQVLPPKTTGNPGSLLVGKVTQKTAGGITLMGPTGVEQKILVTADTKTLSTVAAGEVGKSFADIAEGAMLTIFADRAQDGSLTALSITL